MNTCQADKKDRYNSMAKINSNISGISDWTWKDQVDMVKWTKVNVVEI